MNSNNYTDRLSLVAPCGIDCGICELHTLTPNDTLYQTMVQRGISAEKLPCSGCRTIEGNCPVKPGVCDTWKCVRVNELEFCSACTDFPCNRLQPCANRADILPHNLKVFNLCLINQIGLKAFVEKSAEVRLKYYNGRIEVGNGPQL